MLALKIIGCLGLIFAVDVFFGNIAGAKDRDEYLKDEEYKPRFYESDLYNGEESSVMKRDFIKLMVLLLIGTVAICIIIPIDKRFLFVSLILISIAYSMQWFWDKHFKAK